MHKIESSGQLFYEMEKERETNAQESRSRKIVAPHVPPIKNTEPSPLARVHIVVILVVPVGPVMAIIHFVIFMFRDVPDDVRMGETYLLQLRRDVFQDQK